MMNASKRDRYFPLQIGTTYHLMKFKLRSLRKSDNTEAAKILAEEMANQSPIIQEAYLFLVRFHMNYGDIEDANPGAQNYSKRPMKI